LALSKSGALSYKSPFFRNTKFQKKKPKKDAGAEYIRKQAQAREMARYSRSGSRLVHQNFEEREYISMNGIAKCAVPHSRDSLLLQTVDHQKPSNGVELHTGFLATNMSLVTFPLPVLAGQDGEFHGRSSIKTAKQLLASQRYGERILPAGRQSIGDGEKAPMVVSIDITCFGRDEKKNHALLVSCYGTQ
jgi:hypothetical protein